MPSPPYERREAEALSLRDLVASELKKRTNGAGRYFILIVDYGEGNTGITSNVPSEDDIFAVMLGCLEKHAEKLDEEEREGL